MSLFPSSFFPSFTALHKASSNRFCIPQMIHGARSPPKSFPADIPIPPSFPSLLDVMGATASSYAMPFQEIPILVSIFSLPASRTQSQSHSASCLPALRRPSWTLRLCANRSFFSVLLNQFGAVSKLFRPVECGEFLSRDRCCHSPLTFTQTSLTWLIDSSGIHIDSQTESDGLSDVTVTSADGRLSVTLDPVCIYTLLYPAAR